jgi:hypothetical protein
MKKNRIAWLAVVVAACVTRVFAAPPNIVYVAFNGVNTNPCTRVAPCKTITHALSVVGAGGTVDIVGSGAYDIFTITKSVTVEAEPGVVATIDVGSSGTGITVAAGSSDVVTLRNLNLHGTGGTGFGIQIKTGGLITVEDCVSRNFFHGLDYTASASGNLNLKGGSYEASDTSIFLCCATGASFSATIDGVHVYGGGFAGINADGTQITITHSLVTGPGTVNISAGRPGGINAAHGTTVMENDVISAYGTGVFVYNTAYISSCTITENGVGVAVESSLGGTAFSRGNNTIVGNSVNDVSGTLMPFSPK